MFDWFSVQLFEIFETRLPVQDRSVISGNVFGIDQAISLNPGGSSSVNVTYRLRIGLNNFTVQVDPPLSTNGSIQWTSPIRVKSFTMAMVTSARTWPA